MKLGCQAMGWRRGGNSGEVSLGIIVSVRARWQGRRLSVMLEKKDMPTSPSYPLRGLLTTESRSY